MTTKRIRLSVFVFIVIMLMSFFSSCGVGKIQINEENFASYFKLERSDENNETDYNYILCKVAPLVDLSVTDPIKVILKVTYPAFEYDGRIAFDGMVFGSRRHIDQSEQTYEFYLDAMGMATNKLTFINEDAPYIYPNDLKKAKIEIVSVTGSIAKK